MADSEAPLTYWQSLAVAADQGHLYLNPDAAAACSSACDTYLWKLRDSKARAVELAEIDGYGDFKSGQALRQIFADKAVGGEDNMVDVLQSHIDVVEQMQVVFNKFFTATDNVDDTNAANVRAQGSK
ncbi:hypothetical protein C5142_23075 [Rhodococcus sp. BGS-1C]|jgi:hypothetical protein|uniref:hypothetical protein n=1 Tax=unclassified Rhodococcus (in: high G+C Gram-positive bacteria) TaxID=192944 RepID=UPI00095B802E|nr:hypothetical protein [Rhodococcus sp. KRD197]OLT33131.1 hypothetical protein BJF84_23705 [Rhodococcus sp. CUA-806]